MIHLIPRYIPVVLVLVSLGGCADRRQLQQTDKDYFRFPGSGVSRVIEVDLLEADESPKAPRWSVRETPSLLTETDPDGETIGNLTYAFRIPDGRFVAADAFGSKLFIFSEAGKFEDTWGREGAGPGEFQWPARVSTCGVEGVSVFDAMLNTVSVWGADGTLLSSRRMVSPDGNLTPWDPPVCNSAGTFAFITDLAFPDEIAGTLYRPSAHVVLSDTADAYRAVMSVPGEDRYRISGQDGRMEDFGRRTLLAMSSSHLFVATGDAFEFVSHSLVDGSDVLVTATDVEREPITTDDLEQSFAEQVEANASAPEHIQQQLLKSLYGMEWPAYHPSIEAILVDDGQCLWIRDRADWWVFDHNGRSIATLSTPPGFTLLQVDGAMLVGILEDELGIKSVAAFEFERGSGECGV